MKIVIPGGTGQVGQLLARAFVARGDTVTVISRPHAAKYPHTSLLPPAVRQVSWDGRTVEEWAREIDGADAVINLAGRSVNCRYTPENLKQMMDSRIDSTRAVGVAIAQAKHPPKVWLQMSTATIYSHRFDAPNDEASGQIGGSEPDAPAYWKYSIDIAQAWESTQAEAATSGTRKVALRSAMVMSADRGGIFDVLVGLTRKGLGGAIAGGRQYMSWIHERDFVAAVTFLLTRENISGPVNLVAPEPLPQREFMAILRQALGVRVGLPATAWMVKLGAIFMRTDAELVLKSRRVVPGRLLAADFDFAFPHWPAAAADLVARWRNPHAPAAPVARPPVPQPPAV
ncbi:MAG TPA: TIGR01777 family oxidoreductase [Planctomycetota bacterium]|nr:TIGR01777 family oxidoreductase [Planctomycetota bacterium]